MCAVGTDTMIPWERRALEEPWGFYPDTPRRAN
jgi:hypothetical protein